ncbi:MAG TPA: rubrerythrin family protein, partial [Acidobacteria bacterium]|nr:rubrerythrin family protein [Acidobacteriota bacterium]
MATTLDQMLEAQRAELTESEIYRRLAESARDPHNAEVLRRIAADERGHHDFWQSRTDRQVRPRGLVVFLYVLLARLFGLTFALKLMERGEDFAQRHYAEMEDVEGIGRIILDEEEHEKELIDMLHDEPLEYVGSVVLGLNDALVELTGALAGFTLALGDGRTVALAGLVTGIAASLSMAASEYLSAKTERHTGSAKNPLKAAFYTGAAYVVAVVLLILPFFLITSSHLALAVA